MKNLFKKAFIVFLTIAIASCSDDDDTTFVQPEISIADIVVSTPDFSLLLAAVEKAELTATLAGEGTFTVFAPTNAAFTEFLDGGTLDDFTKEEVAELLLNHVLGTVQASSDLSTTYVNTLATGIAEGTNISMYINTSSGVKINNIATVTQADVTASNGIIHIVDKVIPLPTVVTFATADPNFSTLVSALTELTPSVDFVSILSTPNGTDPAPFTVFAPTNAAFDALDVIPDEAGLIPVLQYHVVAGANVRSTDLSDGQVVTTLETGTFTVNIGSTVTITDENDREITVAGTDVQASNGVIHVVDQVLLPAN